MAKLGGEQTELLQISADERARAARTALLFTRRGADAKLADRAAHLRRFELPAGAAVPPGAGTAEADPRAAAAADRGAAERGGERSGRTGGGDRQCATDERGCAETGGRSSSGGGRRRARDAGGWRREPAGPQSQTPRMQAAVMRNPRQPDHLEGQANPPAREQTPFPAVGTQGPGYGAAEMLTEGALAKAPEAEAAPVKMLSAEHLREAMVSALATAGQFLPRNCWDRARGRWRARGCRSRLPR